MSKILTAYIAAFFISLPLVGQVPFFQQYFLLRKNDAVQINAILQSNDGTMWFATAKGLYNFDGKNYKRYTIQDGLAHDVVTALAKDSLDRVWVGYSTGQLGFLEKDGFKLFSPPEGTAVKAVSDIHFDSKGRMWFSTLNDGLYYFSNNRLYRVDEAEGLPDLYVYDLAEDAKGNIWAGTDGGVAICSLTENKISINVIDYNDGLPDNIIRKIIPENENSVLLATEDAGVVRYNFNSKKHESLTGNTWSYGPASDIIISDDKIWISCPQKGLLLYNQQTKTETLYTPHQHTSLNAIRVLHKDEEGNIWLGGKSGLARTPGEGLQFLERPVVNGSTNILAVTMDQKNNIWFSSNDGLFRRQKNTEQPTMPLSNSPYKKYTVISLYTDSKGYVWAGLYGEGVLRIHPESGKVQHLYRELRNGNVLSIAGDHNTVWLGTLGGATKITFDESDNLLITNYGTSDGLVSDFIYQVFLENNRVWFATDGKGLGMMNRSGFHHYDEGLPGSVVYGLAQDANRKLWVNVQGHGLYVFDGRKFQPCDSSLILRDKNIHALVSDKNGNIVVMHDAGMDVIDIQKNKVVYLGEEVGIRDKINNLNAVGKDKLGNVYFGTSGGIIKYTAEPNLLSNRPRPYLREISVFDTPLDVTKKTLDYDENNITIQFLGILYKNPDGLYYSYQLENYDRNWITTKNQAVTYSRLPAGTYTFRLKVSESQDFSDAPEISSSFTITPPIWQTVPFYVSMAVLLAASVYVFIKSRERKLMRYNALLEEKVALRTREIQQQNEEIQTQNEEISAQSEEILRINENLEDMVQERTRELEKKNKALEEYAFINAHKLRSPVATILGLLNLISKTRLDDEGNEITRRLHHTAEELDCIVSSITKAIERADRKIPKLKDD